MPPTAWSPSRSPESCRWKTPTCPSRALNCSWCEWRLVVSTCCKRIRRSGAQRFTVLLFMFRLCWRICQRCHRDPEHPDSWRWCLPQPPYSHLHGVPKALHLSYVRDDQLQSWSVKLSTKLKSIRSKSHLFTYVVIMCWCLPFSEFEVNIVIVLQDDHLITENFPLKLCRIWIWKWVSCTTSCAASLKIKFFVEMIWFIKLN